MPRKFVPQGSGSRVSARAGWRLPQALGLHPAVPTCLLCQTVAVTDAPASAWLAWAATGLRRGAQSLLVEGGPGSRPLLRVAQP